jgi:hypothetical protein
LGGEGTINDSWSATFRFDDDCVILVNSQRAIDAALKGIYSFLDVRGLKINENKTKIKDLSK